MLKTKDMINGLLYGLEMILGVCVTSLDSSKLQMAGVRHIIYATKSCSRCSNGQQKICVSPEEPMPLAGVASVHPVTLRHEVAVELLTAATVTTG